MRSCFRQGTKEQEFAAERATNEKSTIMEVRKNRLHEHCFSIAVNAALNQASSEKCVPEQRTVQSWSSAAPD